jgi:hypothetical protein
MKNKNITKKQHIIPASYIAQFSSFKEKELRKSKIFYYDLRSQKILEEKAEKLLYEDWYFDFDIFMNKYDNQVNLVEKQIWKLESEYIRTINKDFSEINNEDKNVILHYMLHLYMRTPKIRQGIQEEFFEKMNTKYKNQKDINQQKQHLKSIWKDPNIFDKINTIDWKKEIWKFIHSISVLWYMYPNETYKAQLYIFNKYNYYPIKTKNGKEFISWDHPIVYGSKIIVFPINSKNCLIWINKEIYVKQIKLSIDFINRIVASNSKNIIFWSNKDLVEKYKLFIINKDLLSLRYLDK